MSKLKLYIKIYIIGIVLHLLQIQMRIYKMKWNNYQMRNLYVMRINLILMMRIKYKIFKRYWILLMKMIYFQNKNEKLNM